MASENVGRVEAASPDRRARKRAARRDALLDHAAALIDSQGIEGLTMTALADAADYAPASLYTYFESRSALLAALQQRALTTLARVAAEHVHAWDQELLEQPDRLSAEIASLARLWAFSDLFLSAPRHHRREFRLQQQLLVSPGVEDTSDAVSVLPAALAVLEVPRQLLQRAQDVGALEHHEQASNPVGEALDCTIVRTFGWVLALNGALMSDELSTGMPTTGAALGAELTGALLRGWGAQPVDVATARRLADELAAAVPPGSAAATIVPDQALAQQPVDPRRPKAKKTGAAKKSETAKEKVL